MKIKTPMQLWLTGEGSVNCLDNAIDAWHSGSDNSPLDLRDYLGMTTEQYQIFMVNPTQFENDFPYGSQRYN